MYCLKHYHSKRGRFFSLWHNPISIARAVAVIGWLVLGNMAPASADSTISPNGLGTKVAQDGNQHAVSGGTISGQNQFHSFDSFSVGSGDTVTFNGPGSINNILSRVTGGSQSDINGTLKSNISGANLFLLNPAGVLFGQDAKLDLSGSFYVSTADYIKFDDGSLFRAKNDQGAPLTIAPPQAFGFLGDTSPRAIQFTGSENQSLDLKVADGKAFGVVGGDITLDHSMLSGGAHMLIASCKSAAEVTIKGEVKPENGMDSSEGGEIMLNDSAIHLHDNEKMQLVIRSNDLILDNRSYLLMTSEDNSGQGMNIDVDTLKLKNSSYLGSVTMGSANAGDIYITANNLQQQEYSFLGSATFGIGNAGDLYIRTNDLHLKDMSYLGSVSLGFGDTGNVKITANNLLQNKSMIGNLTAEVWLLSHIFKNSMWKRVNIDMDELKLILKDSSYLDSVTGRSANAGNVDITVDNLQQEDFAYLGTAGFCDTGNVKVTVNNLLQKNSSEIGCAAHGSHIDAGDIYITANNVLQQNSSSIGSRSDDGNTGNIDITVNNLLHQQSSSTIGGESSGYTGSVKIKAENLVMENSQIGPRTNSDVSHNGDIFLSVDRLDMKDSLLHTSNRHLESGSAGNAGNIMIQGHGGKGSNAGYVSITNNSEITSTAEDKGNAGQITLKTDSLHMRNSTISSQSTGQGVAGSIHLGTDKAPIHDLELAATEISVSAENGPHPGEQRQGNIIINCDGNMLLDDGSVVTASVDNGLGGDIRIQRPERMIMDGQSQILAQTKSGQGGGIDVAADLFVSSADSLISADAGVGTSGDVLIDARWMDFQSSLAALSTEFLDVSASIKEGCAARNADDLSSFIITRRQGLPLSPDGLIQAFHMSGDRWRNFSKAMPASDSDDEIVAARNEMTRGAMALRGGQMTAACQNYRNASQLYIKRGNIDGRNDALLDLGQAQMMAGRHTPALNTLRHAVALAEQSADAGRMAAALSKLGNVHLALGDVKGAKQLLSQGIFYAHKAKRVDLETVIQNNLGNLWALQTSFKQALAHYLESARLAERSKDLLAQAKALTNAARAALEASDLKRARNYAGQAITRSKALDDTAEKTYLLINIGSCFGQLAKQDDHQRNADLLNGYAALTVAADAAEESGDQRLHSFALGNLADFYRTENRFDEALYLVGKALEKAHGADTPELISRWCWIKGQLLWAQGRTAPAIDAYQQAISVIEDTRQEVLSQYGSAEVHFRKRVAPVYFDLVDALLQASDKVADERDAKRLWEQARDTMELLKGAELRNYFKDECVTELKAKAVTLESLVDQRRNVAVIYPILLPKRLELLIKTNSGLRRYSIPDCGQEKIRAAVQLFYKTLKSDAFIKPSQDLYDWLVRPYIQDLDDTINTLVFVPDGILRTIAVAALHDGRHFLVEKFQLAVAPALTMVEPKPLDKTAPNPLLAGVSESISFPIGAVESEEHYRALKKVPNELKEVSDLFGGEILLNADFNRERLASALNEMAPSLIHIASHAHFSDNYRESFILAYNQKIFIDELENLIGLARFRKDPIELLMLSACETAAGDERAALGLAGIAVKAGVRSAIGSLWSIADEPAYELVAKFYHNLKHKPACSKAEALRLAQIDLLKSNKYAHPKHWSGFILINNWL